MTSSTELPDTLGRLSTMARAELFQGPTLLEFMPNLTEVCGGGQLYIKRDDCIPLAFGGNKVRQLEFYLGEAVAQKADTVLITGAVQSNFVRLAAAGARKLGMDCHIQLEERVPKSDPYYRQSGNVLLDRLLGATLHSYPEGEDEAGADRNLHVIAEGLEADGKRPFIIPLAPGHAPYGALGYVVAAHELLAQIADQGLPVREVAVASGSGNTHAGLLFGLRVLGSSMTVTGVCVRRDAEQQLPRIRDRCAEIAELLEIDNPVSDSDIIVTDAYLAPGYGRNGEASLDAIMLCAQSEGLLLDPTYTAKTMAGFLDRARQSKSSDALVFMHTGGLPAIFAYQNDLSDALDARAGG